MIVAMQLVVTNATGSDWIMYLLAAGYVAVVAVLATRLGRATRCTKQAAAAIVVFAMTVVAIALTQDAHVAPNMCIAAGFVAAAMFLMALGSTFSRSATSGTNEVQRWTSAYIDARVRDW